MSHPLDGVDAKMNRAVAHIHQLHRDIGSFCDRGPYSVRVQPQTDTDGTAALDFLVVDNQIGTPDVSLVLLAGEAAHQIRSALDHLIHQLVILNGEGDKLIGSRRHQFPIFEDRKGYIDRSPGMINGVSESVALTIEAMQPYVRRPDTPRHDPLWILSDLNNTDKHRLIPVGVVAGDFVHTRDSGDATTWADHSTFHGLGPLKDGELLFRMPTVLADEHVAAQLACTIAFRQVPEVATMPSSMAGVLWQCATAANSVVNTFRKLFQVPVTPGQF